MAETKDVEFTRVPTRQGSYRERVTSDDALNLTWHDITLRLENKKDASKSKTVLNGISGHVEAGQLMAILGPTGSGKTSLLNVLAARLPVAKGQTLSGSIVVNDTLRNEDAFKRATAYVTQDDVLYSHLTVRETIQLSAFFSLPASISKESKEAMAEEVIQELGLTRAADTIIGNDRARGVSGGEKKRVNIGVELITSPVAIFLDEPTSGLDSFQAQSVMECMRSLASAGRTVVASIHQPRSSIVAMCDVLLVISEGDCLYQGPRESALPYFAAQDLNCPSFFNPADFMLDCVSLDTRSPQLEEESVARRDRLAAAWRSDETLSAPLREKVMTVMRTRKGASSEEYRTGAARREEEGALAYALLWLTQFRLLYWRSFVQTTRNKAALMIKVGTSVFIAGLLGMLYSNMEYNQKSQQDRIAILFFITLNQFFSNVFGSVAVFGTEQSTLQREYGAKRYPMSAYYLAKFCSEMPINAVGPALFCVIVYWSAGLNEAASRFITFLGIVGVELVTASAFGLMVSSTSKDPEVANALSAPLILLLMLFAGFYVNIENLPVYISWLRFISPIMWVYQSLMVNEFEGASFSCEDVPVNGTCIATGEEILERLSFDDVEISTGFWALALIAICLNAITYTNLIAGADKFARPGAKAPAKKGDKGDKEARTPAGAKGDAKV